MFGMKEATSFIPKT